MSDPDLDALPDPFKIGICALAVAHREVIASIRHANAIKAYLEEHGFKITLLGKVGFVWEAPEPIRMPWSRRRISKKFTRRDRAQLQEWGIRL